MHPRQAPRGSCARACACGRSQASLPCCTSNVSPTGRVYWWPVNGTIRVCTRESAQRGKLAIEYRWIAEIQLHQSLEFREAVQIDFLPLKTDAVRHDVRSDHAHADDHAVVDAQVH